MTALSRTVDSIDGSSLLTLRPHTSLPDAVRREALASLHMHSTTSLCIQLVSCTSALIGCAISFRSGRYVFDRDKPMTVDARFSCGAQMVLYGGINVPLLISELVRRARSAEPFPIRPYEQSETDRVLKDSLINVCTFASSVNVLLRQKVPFHKNGRSTFGRALDLLQVVNKANQVAVSVNELVLREEEVRLHMQQLQYVVREVATDAKARVLSRFRR